jgi:hypothetical protein
VHAKGTHSLLSSRLQVGKIFKDFAPFLKMYTAYTDNSEEAMQARSLLLLLWPENANESACKSRQRLLCRLAPGVVCELPD